MLKLEGFESCIVHSPLILDFDHYFCIILFLSMTPEYCENHSSQNEINVSQKKLISRRLFVQSLGVVFVSSFLPKDKMSDDSENIKHVSQENNLHSQSNEDPIPSLIETGKETVLLLIAESATFPIFNKLGIPIGNAGADKTFLKKVASMPSDKLVTSIARVVIIEEAAFRLLPNLFLPNNSKDDAWGIGLLSSLLFAGSHNLERNEKKQWSISIKALPFYQFVNGLYFWKVIRERGFPYSVFAHLFLDSIPISLLKTIHKLAPEAFDSL